MNETEENNFSVCVYAVAESCKHMFNLREIKWYILRREGERERKRWNWAVLLTVPAHEPMPWSKEEKPPLNLIFLTKFSLLAGAPTDCVLEVSHLGALYSETRSTVADSLQLQSLQDPLWSSSWDQVPPTQPWPTSMCGRRDQSQCVLPSAEPLYWAVSALVFLVYIGFVFSDLHGSQTLPCQVLPLSSCSKPHAPKDSGCPQTLRAWGVGLPFPFKSLHSPRVGRL